MNWIDAITGIAGFIAKELGDWRWEWARKAAEKPLEASILLEQTAGKLEARAAARRPRKSGRLPWLARRQIAYAKAMRDQAKDLRHLYYDERELCRDNPLRKVGT